MKKEFSDLPVSDLKPQALIENLKLQPHPEGGFFRETYRSAERVLPGAGGADTGVSLSASTAIYYLLCDGAYSSWHRIRSDEMWHFYAGGPLEVHMLTPDGRRITHRLGNPLSADAAAHAGAVFQAVVPAGCWFAAHCVNPRDFALAGCTVAPGFEFSSFELADPQVLLAAYPAEAALIERLSRRAPA